MTEVLSRLQTINFFVRREDFSKLIPNEKKNWPWIGLIFRGFNSALSANIRARSQRAERPAVHFSSFGSGYAGLSSLMVQK